MDLQKIIKLCPERKKNKINYKSEIIEFDIDDYFNKISKELSEGFYHMFDTNIYLYIGAKEFINLLKNCSGESDLERLIQDLHIYWDKYSQRVFSLVNQEDINIIVNEDILKELNMDLTRWRNIFPVGYRRCERKKRNLLFKEITYHLDKVKELIDILYLRKSKPNLFAGDLNYYYNFKLHIKKLLDEIDEKEISKEDKSIMSFVIGLSLTKPTKLFSRDFDMHVLANKIKSILPQLNKTLPKNRFNIESNRFYVAKDKFTNTLKRNFSISFYLTSLITHL